jgi:hypothetical protein
MAAANISQGQHRRSRLMTTIALVAGGGAIGGVLDTKPNALTRAKLGHPVERNHALEATFWFPVKCLPGMRRRNRMALGHWES